MMSRILILFILAISTQIYASNGTSKIESCSLSTLDNGVGYWPWRHAQPFPWNNIQGTWQVAGNNKKTMYFVFKVTKDSSSRKVIDTRVYEEGDSCSKLSANGIAYINANAKNTVRAQIADSQNKYSIKLAWFNTIDLNMDDADCGDSVLGASKQIIGTNKPGSSFDSMLKPDSTENFILKKVSPLLEYSCEK